MAVLGGCVAPPINGSDLFVGRPTLSSQHRPSTFSVMCCTNGAFPRNSLVNDNHPSKNPKNTIDKLESLLYPDNAVAVEKIETPLGLPMMGRIILNKPRCSDCETKGLVVCATCTGSGLYIDSIMESQGIIVKVRCLGCGGSGNVLCSACGGRGHL